MTDKSTIEGFGTAEQFPGLPSFVRQLCEMSEGVDAIDCFDHWAPPNITGYAPLDFDLGRQHCLSALEYSRQIGTASFLLYVVMAMRGREPGDIEQGFIAELIAPALRGRIPPFVLETANGELAALGVDLSAFRQNEAFMARALGGSSTMPDLFFGYVIELVSNPRNDAIGGAIYLLAGAALNGGLN
jgi:hypothetical protein